MEWEYITAIKSFITLTPGVDIVAESLATEFQVTKSQQLNHNRYKITESYYKKGSNPCQ
jgi:hypothetical protein